MTEDGSSSIRFLTSLSLKFQSFTGVGNMGTLGYFEWGMVISCIHNCFIFYLHVLIERAATRNLDVISDNVNLGDDASNQ